MAFITYNSKLMLKTGTTWAELCPIKGIPQIGGEPDQVDCTTCDDSTYAYIPGLQANDPLSFTCNYDKDTFAKISELNGVISDLSIWLGSEGKGEQGKFTGTGYVSCYVNSGDINSVVEMSVVVTPNTKFELETATA